MRNRHALLALFSTLGLGGVMLVTTSVLALPGGGGGGQVQIPTSLNDFFAPGTQPNTDSTAFEPVQNSNNCSYCHGNYNEVVAPFDSWVDIAVTKMTINSIEIIWSEL